MPLLASPSPHSSSYRYRHDQSRLLSSTCRNLSTVSMLLSLRQNWPLSLDLMMSVGRVSLSIITPGLGEGGVQGEEDRKE